jgi:hypothetical protein
MPVRFLDVTISEQKMDALFLVVDNKSGVGDTV